MGPATFCLAFDWLTPWFVDPTTAPHSEEDKNRGDYDFSLKESADEIRAVCSYWELRKKLNRLKNSGGKASKGGANAAAKAAIDDEDKKITPDEKISKYGRVKRLGSILFPWYLGTKYGLFATPASRLCPARPLTLSAFWPRTAKRH